MCKYDVVISDTLVGSFMDALFLLLAIILSGLHEKPRRKDSVTEKSAKKNFCEGYHFLTARPPYYVIFCRFLCLPCVMVSSVNGLKYLLQFDTSWLASLRTWYYSGLCFSFSCSGCDLTLINRGWHPLPAPLSLRPCWRDK